MEQKQKICDLLACTLRETRNLSDLTRIDYDSETETAVVHFENSDKVVKVCVAMDSGMAMIDDIIKRLR